MIIIIEGTDGVGKTTIAKAMAEKLGYEYRHTGPPTQETWQDEYLYPLVTMRHVVLDRWHVGEMVWPAIFRRESLFPSVQSFQNCCRAINLAGHARDGVRTILVTRERLAIEDTLRDRDEPEDAIQAALAGQREFMRVAAHVPFQVDFRIMKSDDLFEEWVS